MDLRKACVALGALLVATTLPSTPAATARPPRLVRDSLSALDGLVSRVNCERRDAADGDASDGVTLPYRFCDDGVPPPGGGEDAIPVPVAYHSRAGNDWRGLPRPARGDEAARKSARHDLRPESGNRISLDVDVSLPTGTGPRRGRPVIVFMHGCCGGNKNGWEAASVDAAGEKWHHSNAWFAARGYVVVTYTARGFVNSENRGSTGTTQLDSRRFEINDYQYLVGLLADHDARRRRAGKPEVFNVDPDRAAAVGGSYGGGFSWLALTDPTWRSPARGIRMRLRAAVPKYGWTDLVEALVPAGHYRDRDASGGSAIAPTRPRRALSFDPIGVKKESIVDGLYASANLAASNHANLPQEIHTAASRLSAGEPYDGDPVVERLALKFLRDRSAYFQRAFWRRVRDGLRVPLYTPATWTDPLFTTIESVRFYNKLKAIAPGYPMKMYLGDYQHFAANKPKEWGDMCGDDHHVCTLEDSRRADGRLTLMRPRNRVRAGINTRINRFLDYYLRGRGARPVRNVSATTTICPANATPKYPVDEPGIEYRAADWRGLAPGFARFSWRGGGVTSSTAVDGHAAEADPVFRATQDDICHTIARSDPGPGVVQYTSEPLAQTFTMMGIPRLHLDYTTAATDYWVAVRMYDLAPDDRMTMVTRGVCRVNEVAAPEVDCHDFDLFGNGWRFGAGHRLVLEITQADTPFLRRDNFASALDVTGAEIELPVSPDHLRRDFRD